MPRHRGPRRLTTGAVALLMFAGGACVAGGLSLGAVLHEPAPLPARTVIVPGPTVTISYLLTCVRGEGCEVTH